MERAMGRAGKWVLAPGLLLVVVPTGAGSVMALDCEGDGCLGILVLWAGGLLAALLLVLALTAHALLLRWKTGSFPPSAWRLSGIVLAAWAALVGFGFAFANSFS